MAVAASHLPPKKPRLQPSRDDLENFGAGTLEKSCPDCGHQRCQTCEPGYMNLVVNMKEFSKNFAEEMKVCTLCEHWLCPGSALVVLLRCHECGHEQCQEYRKSIDEKDEEWYSCCLCEVRSRASMIAVPESKVEGTSCKMASSMDNEVLKVAVENGTEARKGALETLTARGEYESDDEQINMVQLSIRKPDFPEWLVGGDRLSPATKSHGKQRHRKYDEGGSRQLGQCKRQLHLGS